MFEVGDRVQIHNPPNEWGSRIVAGILESGALDDFWDTENDWHEGQRVEVVAYAEFPYCLKECALMEVE